jgi:diaminopimelate epimerase
VKFEKWQALGNDYLIVEADALPWELTPARIKRICDPHRGVGADGILLVDTDPADSHYVASLRIFNPDGSESGLSGNGSREAIMYLRRRGHTDRDEFAILTPSGPIHPRVTGATTCIGELEAAGARWRFRHVAIGNPQCAIAYEALEELDLGVVGPPIEHHALFPNRTNVSWYRELEPSVLRARIFERGAGETLASGTGASGAAIAHHLDGGPRHVTVRLDGGELVVDIGPELDVTLSGWAVPVFAGTLADDFVKELDETQ